MSEQQGMDYTKAFRFHGLELRRQGTQIVGDCPFCSHGEGHFYANPTTGGWDCKYCQKTGNYFGFLGHIAEKLPDQTALAAVAASRGLKAATLLHVKATFNDREEVLLPSLNERAKLANLYRVVEIDGKKRILSSPTCQQHPYQIDTLRKQKRVWLCEGHWDTLAWLECLAHLDFRPAEERFVLKGQPNFKGTVLAENCVLGIPGAGTFKDTWAAKLRGKEVILLYDNDEAGEKGMEKVISLLAGYKARPASLQRIRWKSDDPKDINDLYRLGNPLWCFQQVNSRLEEIDLEHRAEVDEDIPDIDAKECEHFSDLVSQFKRYLHWTVNIEQTLACLAAVVISTKYPGGQLGLRIIGPPGSAKSTLAECFSYMKNYVYPRSKFTGFVSGWHKLEKSDMAAFKMKNRCVIIKEADTLLQLTNLAQVESEIRDILGDGVIRVEYRNGQETELQATITMVLCGTKSLRKMDDSLLGSRFIDCVIHSDEDNHQNHEIVDRTIRSQLRILSSVISGGREPNDLSEIVQNVAPYVHGFVRHKIAQIDSGTLDIVHDDGIEKQIRQLGEFVAFCRAKIDRDRDKNLLYKPEKELSTRLGLHLSRLATFLAVVLHPGPKCYIDQKVFDIITKVVKDTACGFPFDAIQEIRGTPRGLNKEQLAFRIGIPNTQAAEILVNLSMLGIVGKESVHTSNGRGRNSHFYRLTPAVQPLADLVFRKDKPHAAVVESDPE